VRNRNTVGNKLDELRIEQESLLDRAQAILAKAKAEDNRELTKAEGEEVDAAMARLDEVTAEVHKLDGTITSNALALANELKGILAMPRGRKTEADPIQPNGGMDMSAGSFDVITPRQQLPARPIVAGPKSYERIFNVAKPQAGGWKNAGEFWAALVGGRWDPRFQNAYSGASEGVDSGGGFTVPGSFSAEMMNMMLEENFFLRFADVIPGIQGTASFPMWDDQDQSTSAIAGLGAYWVGEGVDATPVIPKLRRVVMRLSKLMTLVPVTNELLEDNAADFAQRLQRAIAQNLSFVLLWSFFNADGVGKPLGIRNAPCTITQSRTAGTSAGSVTAADLVGMYSRLSPSSVPNAAFVAHRTNLPSLLLMTISTGNSASPIYLPGNPGNLANAPSGTLLGRPLYISEAVPEATSTAHGSISLVDATQYAVALGPNLGAEAGPQIAASEHAAFVSDQTLVRARLRVAGAPKRDLPITPTFGTLTHSPFVQLAQRST
jgi:HK97 family phage major capsid protein